jgi:hypothetical protein
MNSAYTFIVLRYVHDPVVGEFINFGVVVYSSKEKFLRAKCNLRYGRLSKVFGEIEGDQYKAISEYIQGKVDKLSDRYLNGFKLEETPETLTAFMAKVLPLDDSSIQVSEEKFGLGEDFEKILDSLFEKYVLKSSEMVHMRRNDDDVWSGFRKKLDPIVATHLDRKIVTTADAEYEFKHAWKNQRWHLIEPLSFDYADSQGISTKAFRWLGIGEGVLGENKKDYLLQFIIGRPTNTKFQRATDKALNILHKMACKHEFIYENEAQDFANSLKKEIKTHLSGK